jgi:predicted ester cyclase
MKVMVEDQVTEGDKVVNRMTITGTHQGEFMGVPATGKSFSLLTVAIFRVRDGSITHRWGQADVMGMMQLLGAAPQSAGAS